MNKSSFNGNKQIAIGSISAGGGGGGAVSVMRAAVLLLLSTSFRWLITILLSLVWISCAGGGGGGGSSVNIDDDPILPTSPPEVRTFTYIQPDTDSVLLNWTNPAVELHEGIYKFTIDYEAIQDSAANRSQILDWDMDGVNASIDNCLHIFNPAQLNSDGDEAGDACDSLNSSLSFIPSEDSVRIRWLNPLIPADAGEIMGYEQSMDSFVGSDLDLSLSDDALQIEWVNPPSNISGLAGQPSIIQFEVEDFFTHLANKAEGEHEAAAAVSVSVPLMDLNETTRELLVPHQMLRIALEATYTNGTDNATVEIRSECVLISFNNQLAPCSAKPQYGVGSAAKIKYFNLTVSGPSSYADEVILDDVEQYNLSYSGDDGNIEVWYTYNATGLISGGNYSFLLGITYDSISGVERGLNSTALTTLSPVKFSYSGSVVLGSNHDGDGLADSEDRDDDADGILDTTDGPEGVPNDLYRLRSALAGEVEIIYNGSDDTLDLYESNGTAHYELEGLATESYYLFNVQAHVRQYHNPGLAARLGYRGINQEIGNAYNTSQSDQEIPFVSQRGIFIGKNTDKDQLADTLDPDDDNDGLLDTEEVDSAGTPLMVGGVLCSLVADCDRDGLTDAEEYYSQFASYINSTGRVRNCLLNADCDGDGVTDDKDDLPIDARDTVDTDRDGIGDSRDNCLYIPNTAQLDGDGDGRGDACEGKVARDSDGRIYHYGGSATSPDLTLLPSEDKLSIDWVHLYSSDIATALTAHGANITEALISWEVYNLEHNPSLGETWNASSWTIVGLNSTGIVNAYRNENYKVGSTYHIELSSSNINGRWYSAMDIGYRFKVAFSYDTHSGRYTVYEYPPITPSNNLVRLLLDTDGDGYADVIDPNADNDGLLNDAATEWLMNSTGGLCRLLEDCDGDGVADDKDDLPIDARDSVDTDRDGIGDSRDTYTGEGLDSDGDGIGDNMDSCSLRSNSGEDIDGDHIDDACDVNPTVQQNLWLVPQDRSLVISWRNPSGVGAFNVSLFFDRGDERIALVVSDKVAADLASGSLAENEFAHYRYSPLTNNISYSVEVVLLNEVGGSPVASFGSEDTALYSMVVGMDTDGDFLVDLRDTDDDGDGLEDTHAKEQMMNGDISCSLLVDCDGDGVADDEDDLPIDAGDSVDSDGDGVGDNTDQFPTNDAETVDSDYDGYGDNIDNCPYVFDIDDKQINRDGDEFGLLCDDDDTNTISGRVVWTSLTDEETEDDGLGNTITTLSSEVLLTWTNPTNLYLSKAIEQGQSLDVTEFDLEIWSGDEKVSLDGLNISSLAGTHLMNVADLDTTAAGIETGYRVAGLANGTVYRFVIRATYEYRALREGENSHGVQESELRTETIILANIEVLTPAITGVPVVNFNRALSGEDSVSLYWTPPTIPRDYHLTVLRIVGCRLADPTAHCDASQGGSLYEVSDLAGERFVALDTGVLERARLYNMTLKATYDRDGELEELFGQAVQVAIYPNTIPGPMGLATQDGEGSFQLSWQNVNTVTATGYDLFEQIGEGIASYNLTIRDGAFDGAGETLRVTRIFTDWENFRQQITSDDAIIGTRLPAGRFYHVELSAVYTTGQQSTIGASDGTYVKAAIWPSAESVSDLRGEVSSDVSFRVEWTNPSIAGFRAIGQGIDRFLIQACKRNTNPKECSNEVTANGDATDGLIDESDGLVGGEIYEFSVTVVYSTNQRSEPAVSQAVVRLPFSGTRIEVVLPDATDDSFEHLQLSWTNPAEIDDWVIKQFRITPCRFENAAAETCQPQSEIILDATHGLSTVYGATNTYAITTQVDRSYLYNFTIAITYDDLSADDDINTPGIMTPDKGVLLSDTIPGVNNVMADNSFGAFSLSWSPPSDSDIMNFANLGEGVSSYSIEIAGLGVMTANFAAHFDRDSNLYTVANDQLVMDGGGDFNLLEGRVYDASIVTIYSNGQSSPPVVTKVSLGPSLAALGVMAVTKQDSLDISWTGGDLPQDLQNLGYQVNFSIGVDCGNPAEITNCKRNLTDPVAVPTTIIFGPTVATDQQGSNLTRGQWYQAVVDASYVAPDGNAITRSASDGGGIYPVARHVINAEMRSGNSLGMYYEWPDVGATSEFQRNTNYGRSARIVAVSTSGTAPELGWSTTARTAPHTNPVAFTPSRVAGYLWDLTAETIYQGRDNNYRYRKTVSKFAGQGGVYPPITNSRYPNRIAPRVRDVRIESGDTMRVRYNAPNFDTVGPAFRSVLDYGVRHYEVKACKQADSSVCQSIITSELQAEFEDTMENITRGVFYDLHVKAQLEGRRVWNITDTRLQRSFEFISRDDHYINPLIEEVHNISNLVADQVEGRKYIRVSFMKPSDVTVFEDLGFESLTYNLSLYDSGGNLVADTLEIPQLLSALEETVIRTIGFNSLAAADGYYIRVRTIYPNGQFVDARSPRFAISNMATDVDKDDDGLIEIIDRIDFALLRQDLSGASLVGESRGCPTTGCIGYELTGDIMLTGTWFPIGDDANATDGLCWGDGAFTGILDGNGHTIQGLAINQADNDCVGLFAQLKGAEVRNLSIEATEIIGLKNVGVVAGWAEDIVIDTVHVKSQSLKGVQAVGGLVGRIHLDDGSSAVSMHATATDGPQLVSPAATASIKDSSARSERITACASAGGLVGESDRIMIEGSYAISRTISLPFDQASEPTDIDCTGVRSAGQITHHVYSSIGGLVGDGYSSLWQGEGTQWDESYGTNGRIIINIGDYLVGENGGETRFPADGISTATYGDLNLKSIVEGGTRIISSYALSGNLTGNWKIGGLMGDGSASILQDSYAVTKNIHARLRTAGGLIGEANSSDILRSYAISGTINASGSSTGSADSDHANGEAGGLIGRATGDVDLQSTYAIANSIIGGEEDRGEGLGSAAGLLGSRYNMAKDSNSNLNYILNNSYALFRHISGFQHRPLVGRDVLTNVLLDNTYWDTNATLHQIRYYTIQGNTGDLSRTRFASVILPTESFVPPIARPSISLRDGRELTGYTEHRTPIFTEMSDIYSEWKKVSCDGGTAAWNFGSDMQYPAIVCTPDELADQRAWYSLDANDKIRVNTNLIDTTITTLLQ